MSRTKELSIFIDESGDFGQYDPHSPFYIVSIVFHDQNGPRNFRKNFYKCILEQKLKKNKTVFISLANIQYSFLKLF